MAKIIDIIKQLLGLGSLLDNVKAIFKAVIDFIKQLRVNKIEKEKQAEHEAIEKLKQAQTKEEIDAAAEEIGKHI